MRAQMGSMQRTGALRLTSLCLLACWLGCMTGCQPRHAEGQRPVAKAGVIDLRDWDFGRDGPVKLDGEWRFYWQQFIMSDQINSQTTSQNSHETDSQFSDRKTSPAWIYLKLPRYWNNLGINGKTLSGKGYASFALTILLPEASPSLGLKTVEIMTAHAVYVDGKQVTRMGQPGTDAVSSIPHGSPSISEFTPNGAEIDLVV